MNAKTDRGRCEVHGDFDLSPEYREFLQDATRRNFDVEFAPNCPGCEGEKKLADEERKKLLRLYKLKGNANVPQRFVKATFGSFVAETEKQKKTLIAVQAYAIGFEESRQVGRSMIWCGPAGTGKTLLACGLIDALIGKGYSAKYTTLLDASKRIKATYGKGAAETESAAIKDFIKPTLLVMDEIGIGYNSETEQLHLWEIISGRYNESKPTILISNLVVEEVKALIGDRITDRMRENGGTVRVFDWSSYRARKSA